MEYLFDVFEYNTTLYCYIFELLLEIIKSVQAFIVMLLRSIISIPSVFSFLPSDISFVIVGLFSFVVIYKILGRE